MAVIYGDDLANDLSGTAGADSIYGLGGGDTISGDAGAEPFGEVSDWLEGGAGDDVYNLYRSSDRDVYSIVTKVKEGIDQGYDAINLHTVGFVQNYQLAPNVEELNLYGDVGVAWGNDLDNVLTSISGSIPVYFMAGGGDDLVYGSDFGDQINGGSGTDGMLGGKGDDFYVVDDKGDIVIEFANQGLDEVQSTALVYKLSNNVENLYLSAGAVQRGSGNSLDNYIEGWRDYTKFINGGAGNDTVRLLGSADDLVNGGSGNDTLQAGLGNDIYRTSGTFGHDEITDTGGDDAVEFDVNECTLWFSKSGNDLNVSVIGTQNGVTIKNWYSDATAKIEEFYAGTGKMLSAAKVDTLVSAMSAFAQPTTAALPANIQTALAPTLAAVWQ